jgi:precorrin-6A/cobalt-precorrin-6A reductase
LSFCDFAADHEQAARLAFAAGRPVLLTTGSTNLGPYVGESKRTGLALIARVLPRDDAVEACLRAGLPRERIIAAKGPFSVEVNRGHIRQFAAGVLVTKDSGRPGGVDEKLQAARLEGCRVVIVQRPARPDAPPGATFEDIDELVEAVRRAAAT